MGKGKREKGKGKREKGKGKMENGKLVKAVSEEVETEHLEI